MGDSEESGVDVDAFVRRRLDYRDVEGLELLPGVVVMKHFCFVADAPATRPNRPLESLSALVYFSHEKPGAVFLVVCDPSMNEL